MHITGIKINNILSIESAELNVSANGLTLIDGWNYDDDRANGAGKTAICNAIAFALYDKVPRKITKSEILRFGAKQGYAEVTLSKAGRTYRINRKRPSAVEYYIDDEKKEITQEEFESMIGLNYDQFITSMYNSQGSSDNFIFLNDKSKKNFLLDLMNLSVFNQCHKATKDAIKNEQSKINQEKIKLQGYLSKVEAYSESLVDVTAIQDSIRNKEKEIQELQEKMKPLLSVQKPDLSNFDALETKINDKRKKFVDMRQNIAVLRSEYKNVETEIVRTDAKRDDGDHVNCPACNTGITITGDRVSLTSDTEALRKHIDDVIVGHKQKLATIAADINSLESDLLKERELDKLQSDLKIKRQAQYSDYNKAQQSIADIQRIIDGKQSVINTHKQSISDSASLELKINELKKTAKKYQSSIKSSMDNMELLESAAQVFSPTGAPAYIMDSIIEAFNASVAKYVQLIWPSASYELQAYKEKKDGTKTAKFSETLMISGKPFSIGSLSGGQQKALSLAVDFAIIDTMGAHFGIHMNPIMLDEPFDGLDAVGREIVIDLLESLSVNRNIWVVDHASEAKAMFNNVIRVEKRSGITNVLS